jgi:hypothetical protein
MKSSEEIIEGIFFLVLLIFDLHLYALSSS